MTKVILTTPASFVNDASAVAQEAANNAALTAAIENTLSRDGTGPNQMGADFDMNSHRILNLPAPLSGLEPLRLIDATSTAAQAGALAKLNNLSDLTNVAAAKVNLSLVKADVGLGNVDNTSDVNKPVSTAQSAAIATGVASVTKTSIGLGNVDNTSDVNKPLSTADTAALGLKAPLASPALTGTPTAPTQAALLNSTALATTAYVDRTTREKLTANRIINVVVGGLAAGVAIAQTLDTAGFSVTIKMASGTYTEAIAVSRQLVGGGPLYFEGDLVTPANVIWNVTSNNGLVASLGAVANVQGIEFRTTTAGDCLVAFDGGQINISGNCRFGACAGSHRTALNGGRIHGVASYSVTGSAVSHRHTYGKGYQDDVSITITLVGTPAMSSYWDGVSAALSAYAAVIFAGTGATGLRFLVHDGGRIDTSGSGLTYLPGNVAGVIDTCGEYDALTTFSTVGAAPTSSWAIDATGASTASIANGGNLRLATGNGLLVIRDNTTGSVALWLVGAANCILVSNILNFVASTTTPPAGKCSVAFDGTGYAIYNNLGSAATFTVCSLRVCVGA